MKHFIIIFSLITLVSCSTARDNQQDYWKTQQVWKRLSAHKLTHDPR